MRSAQWECIEIILIYVFALGALAELVAIILSALWK